MASIFKSSIGKKLLMSISGLCLILFLTFHMVMNLTYVFDPDSVVYGTICEILSMGWVNVVVPILAAFFVWRMVPETKGKTLEEMSALWRNRQKAK